MATENKPIFKIILPDGTACEIIPQKMKSGEFVVTLPELSANDTIAVTSVVNSQIQDVNTKIDNKVSFIYEDLGDI